MIGVRKDVKNSFELDIVERHYVQVQAMTCTGHMGKIRAPQNACG